MPKELGDLDELDPKAKPTTLSLPLETRKAINRLRRQLKLDKAAHVVRKSVEAYELGGSQKRTITPSKLQDVGLVDVITSPEKFDFSDTLKTSEAVVAIIPNFADFAENNRHYHALGERLKTGKKTRIILPTIVDCDEAVKEQLDNSVEAVFHLLKSFSSDVLDILRNPNRVFNVYSVEAKPVFLIANEDYCWWGGVALTTIDDFPIGHVYQKTDDAFGVYSQLLRYFNGIEANIRNSEHWSQVCDLVLMFHLYGDTLVPRNKMHS